MNAALARFLSRLALGCFRAPGRSLALCWGTWGLALALAALGMDLRLDWTYLFPSDDPVVREFEEARAQFPYPGDIVVLVDGGRSRQRERYLDLLAERLAKAPDTFHHVSYKFDLEPLAPKLLYYLEVEQLAALRDALRGRDETKLSFESDVANRLLLHLMEQLETALRTRGRARLEPPWGVLLPESSSQAGEAFSRLLAGQREFYATLDEGRIHLLALKSGTRGAGLHEGKNTVGRLREVLDGLRPQAYGLRVRLTGLPVLLHDERATCARDGWRSVGLSLLGVSLVFALGFGGWRRPAMALGALVCGLGWTLGYATLAVGHLNFITVSMVTMLLGLGIDFGVHLLFRFEEEQRLGSEPEEALRITVEGTGLDILVGALATAVAFLSLILTGFRGVADLGVLASGGVLLCYLATVTVLPAFLGWRPSAARPQRLGPGALAWFEAGLLRRATLVCGLAFLLSVASAMAGLRVGFESNLLMVQNSQLESVRTEKEMVRRLNRTVLSAATIAVDAEQAHGLATRLQALPSVQKVSSLAPFFPAVSPEKQRLVEEIVRLSDSLRTPEPVPMESAEDLLRLRERAGALRGRLPQRSDHPELAARLEELKSTVGRMEPGPLQDGLRSFQEGLLREVDGGVRLLRLQKAEPPGPEDIPTELRIRSLSPEGRFLVTVSPARNIWEQEHLAAFLQEVRRECPSLVGHPVVQEHILSSFRTAFRIAPWCSFLGVLLVLGVYLRKPTLLLAALLPTGLGLVGVFGVMGWLGLHFNVVNFVGLPISIGIGAVYGVHALHRMKELGHQRLLSSSTGPALVVSGLTTWIGFSSLATAAHRGMQSLGLVVSVGVAVNLVVSLLVLPCLVRRFSKEGGAG